MLCGGEFFLELGVSARETPHFGEIALTLDDLVLQPGAEIDDWDVDEIVNQEQAKDTGGDLYQQALTRFQLLITAARLVDKRIEPRTAQLDVRPQLIAEPFAQIIEPRFEHSGLRLPHGPSPPPAPATASLNAASIRKSTLLGSDPALAWLIWMVPKYPLWSSARLA